ncbi:DUF711 family protein, partial [archaeon]
MVTAGGTRRVPPPTRTSAAECTPARHVAARWPALSHPCLHARARTHARGSLCVALSLCTVHTPACPPALVFAMAQPTLLTIEEARACTIVRTLTAFTHIPAWRAEPAAEFEELVAPALSQSVRLLLDGAHRFTAAGYNVQTLRLVTTPCEGYLALHDAAAAQAQLQRVVDCVARCCRAWKLPDSAGAGERPAGAGFVQPPLLLNIGRCSARVDTDTLAALLLAHSHVSASMDLPLTDDGVVDDGACAAAADMMSKLAQRSEGGLGNFQFCASAAMPTRCPFFPAAHTTQDDTPAGALQFALGLQHVDLCVTVAERCVATPTLAGSTHAARVAAVRDGITEHLDRVLTDAAHVAAQLAAGHGATFVGVDTSVAP